MQKDSLLQLLRAKDTVFTTNEVALLWGETDARLVRKRLYRYVKSGKLYPLRRGIYARIKDYDKYELATKIYTPAYISYETVLAKAGVIFQFYSQVFVASYLTREIIVDKQTYSFRKIKDSILTNPAGIESKDGYSIATPERALLDIIYHNKDYHFDHLGNIEWDSVLTILPIYGGNKRMEQLVNKYQKATQKGIM